jgi:anti-sigma-K factor RskA
VRDRNDNQDFDDVHDLAAVYALDALDDTERVEFEVHLAGCETCQREVAEFREAATHLGDATAVTPPSGLRPSVLAGIAATPQQSAIGSEEAGARVASIATARSRDRSSGRRWMVPIGIAAGLIIIVSAAVIALNGGSGDVTLAEVTSADDVMVATLEGDDADLLVSWSPELGRVAVEADELVAAGAGQAYELWAIVGETPVAAGLIEHDGGDVRAVFEVDETDVGAWGITIEPAGGSDVPTPPILYFGEIS